MIKKIFQKTALTMSMLAMSAMMANSYAADLDMINNISASITKNNTSEFMTLLPAGVQSQQLYALTSGRPYLFAVNYPEEAVTMIYSISSTRDFKTGQINMNVKRITPAEASKKWNDSPRKAVLFGSTSSPKDPFSQFSSGSNRLLSTATDSKTGESLQSQNWNQANSYSIPAILGQLSLIYNAQQASFVVLETWTDVRQWEEGDWLRKDYYAKNSTWVKPHVYTSELRENLGTRGAFSSYQITNCSGKCTVVSPIKFVKSSDDGEIQARFMEAWTSPDLHLGGGWNSLIVVAFAVVTGQFWAAAAFLASSALQGNSLTNTYISTNDLVGGIVSSFAGPVGGALGGAFFTDEVAAANVQTGASTSTLLGIGNTVDTTGTNSTIGTMIDRSTIDNVSASLGVITQSDLQAQKESADKLAGAYQEIQNTIINTTSTAGGTGMTGASSSERYRISGYNPTPVGAIMGQYITPYSFTENGNTVTPTFYNPWVNQNNQKFARQSSQDATNDVKLLRSVTQEEGSMLQMGGNTYVNAQRQSQTYNGTQQVCIPSANAPC